MCTGSRVNKLEFIYSCGLRFTVHGFLNIHHSSFKRLIIFGASRLLHDH